MLGPIRTTGLFSPGAMMSWAFRASMLAIAVLCSSTQNVHGEDVPAASDPVFTAQFLDGRTISGRLAGIGLDGSLNIVPTGGTGEQTPLTRLLKLTRESSPSNFVADGSFLVFPDGDRLQKVSIGTVADNALDVTSTLLGKLKVPLDGILGVVFVPPPDRDALDLLWDRVRNEPRASEVIWMANGDRRAGGFLGLDDRYAKLQVDMKQVEIDRAGIIALGFDPGLVNYPRPKSPFFEVSLADGTRLGMIGCQLDRGVLTGMTRFGQRIHFPMAEVVGFHVRSDSVEFLSEREVAGVQYVAYVGPPRPYRIDRAVDGRGLQLSGVSYERGLGTQSRTLLAYKLKPVDRRFQAMVGVDDRAGPFGSVAFRVLVDGKERFLSPAMSVRDAPKPIDIDLAGAKTLILITEFGERGDVRDLADWAEARILH